MQKKEKVNYYLLMSIGAGKTKGWRFSTEGEAKKMNHWNAKKYGYTFIAIRKMVKK